LGYPGADNHIFFDGTGKVWVPFQNYISVPLLQLVDKLLEVLSTEGTLPITQSRSTKLQAWKRHIQNL